VSGTSALAVLSSSGTVRNTSADVVAVVPVVLVVVVVTFDEAVVG
jgi:hypothetical protein